ncbi:MAG: hypothetical protein D3924_07535 [Candidatus Electrothrix sp. AR4]|nr:hypothetical protein [Candidatus Electrothrix sp. AR4]
MKLNTPINTSLTRSRPIDLLRIVFSLLLCIFFCFNEASPSEEQKKVRIRIGQLQHNIKKQLDKIQENDEEELGVLDELEKITRKLTRQRKKTSFLKKQLGDQEKLLPELKKKIELIEGRRGKLQQHMLKRLRSFYMMGKIGTLNVTFSKKNLPDLMLFSDAFQHLVVYDEKIVTHYRKTLNELEQASTAHELEKSLLEELLRQTEEEQQMLGSLRTEQLLLLDKIKKEKGVYRRALEEMRKAEEELLKTLMNFRLSDNLHRTQGLLLGKGRLSSPVTGTVLHRFGDIVQTGIKKGDSINGITVSIEPGTSVHAVYKGKVAYADYKRGYGNVVIIDHGGDYFTVTSRLDSILVNAGDKIQQDQKIGTSGDIATLYEPGLYFEIRHGSTAMDPLEWLEIE